MSSRLEYKYLAHASYLDDIRKEVTVYMNHDPYAEIRPKKEYTVRSIYYDTNDLLCYEEKYEGYKIRNKYRIRVYNEPDEGSIAFLEIKRKNENFISKDRAKVFLKDLHELLKTGNAKALILQKTEQSEDLEAAEKFLYHYYSKRLIPLSLVVYEREAFMGKFGFDLRLTFDKNLRGAVYPGFEDLYSEQHLKKPFSDYFILEVKFHERFPHWIPQLINKYNLQRMSISKYTNCIDVNKSGMQIKRALAW